MSENNPPYVTVAHGSAGYFACIMRYEPQFDSYSIQAGGMSTRRQKSKAEKDAVIWALRENMEYRP